MKKINLFAIALFTAALAFMGCSSSSGSSGTVDDVSVSDVVSEAKEAGIVFNSNAQAVESKTVFESSVLPAIESSLKNSGAISALGIKNLRSTMTASGASRAAITKADIDKAQKDLDEQIAEFTKAMSSISTTGKGSASIDWSFPRGEYTVQDGIVLEIDDYSIEADLDVSDNEISGDADIVIEGFNTASNPPSVICRKEEAGK